MVYWFFWGSTGTFRVLPVLLWSSALGVSTGGVFRTRRESEFTESRPNRRNMVDGIENTYSFTK